MLSDIIPRSYILYSMPYNSQWPSPEFVDVILKTEDRNGMLDPNWKDYGTIDPEEYKLWSRNTCGMSCLRSILQYTKCITFPIMTLAKRCTEYGGYIPTSDDIEGMFYQPFVDYLKGDFNLNGRVANSLTLEQILQEVSRKNFVIASVSPLIRDPRLIPPTRGGHLVLITGYDLDKSLSNDECGVLYIHDSTGYYNKNQKYAEISINDFMKFFAEKGIIIENPKN